MMQDHWQRIEGLFEAALQRPPGERDAFLDEACAGDPELRNEVAALVQAHEQAADFIEAPAVHAAAELLSDESAGLMEGQRVGPYKILREIGRGGMGCVYLGARADDQYRKRVAIKLVTPGPDSKEVLRRFRQERQILASLDHPNIAKLLDGGTTEDGLPYLVMDYIEGAPMDVYCDTRRLSTVERLKLFRTVCSAVQYAHQNLVVHRDLKPSNILVTTEGTPKLLDFGIAKILNPDLAGQAAEPTVTALPVMTPEYASPEQIRGEPITTASDVYSLGVVLYQLLTGQRPYRITSHAAHEVARAVCEQEPEKPSLSVVRGPSSVARDKEQRTTDDGQRTAKRLRRQLSGDLDTIVLMALRKEPQRRYASVEQLSEDIRRHLEGLPVIARKDTLGYRAGKFVKRHAAGVAAVVIIILTLIGGIIATTWQARVASEERDRAQRETAKAERINAFLKDMLGSVRPDRKGREVTVVEVLDEAARRVDTELAAQPDVAAAVKRTIATDYLVLGLFDSAAPLIHTSLETDRKLYGEEHQAVAEDFLLLGGLHYSRGNYAEAEPLYQKALAIYRKVFGEENGDVGRTLNYIGLLLTDKGDAAAAEPYYREALAIYRKVYGNNHAEVATVLNNLAVLRNNRGDFDEASDLYREAIDIMRKLPGPELPTLATSLQNLGVIHRMKGEYAQSEPLLREAVELRRKILGQTHPHVAIAQSHLGEVYYFMGDYVRAEEQIRQALDIQRKTLPAGHLDFARSLPVLGLILTKTGKATQGEPYLREALKIRSAVLPKGHWLTASVESALGECLTAEKRYADAEALLTKSYADLKAGVGAEHPRTVETAERLVQLYEAWRKPEKAAEYRARLPKNQ